MMSCSFSDSLVAFGSWGSNAGPDEQYGEFTVYELFMPHCQADKGFDAFSLVGSGSNRAVVEQVMD